VVEAHQVQNGRLQVVDVHLVLDGLIAEVVGGAVGHAAFDAAAGEHRRKAVDVMVAPVADAFEAAVLNHRRPAELAADDDERIFEQAALLEVFEQRRDGPIGGLGQLGVHADIVVAVPGLEVAEVDLHHAHAFFGQA
jgi:hypothetical protein